MKRARILALTVAAVATAFTTAATAGDGLHGGLPWFGYGYSGSLYGLGRVPVPPYFALHPPVYYSQPIPRPYGHSPFAWRSSDLRNSKSELTVNPYFKPTLPPPPAPAVDAEEISQTASVISNPFFIGDKRRLVSDSH